MKPKAIHPFRGHRVAAIAAIALALSVTGCSTVESSEGSGAKDETQSGIRSGLNWESSTIGVTPVTVNGDILTFDTGATKVVVEKGDGLNIAFFNAASNTTYTQAMAKGVEDMAEELDATVTTFEAGWDANKQLSQIENAISSGKYNAFVVYAAEGATVCSALTEQAPAAGIAVIPVITPLCGKTLEQGEALITPGSISTIMGGGTVEYYQLWADFVSSQITEPTQVVYIAGPSGQDVVMAAEEAVRNAAADNPNFELLDVYYADYSGDSALKATQNALVTHPDTQVILSHFSTITIGVLSALADAGKENVQVYDLGGDETVKTPLLDGRVVASVPYFPYSTGACSVDILNSAFAGETVPQLVLSECGTGGKDTSTQNNVIVDKSNVDSFKFEY